jgi:transposase
MACRALTIDALSAALSMSSSTACNGRTPKDYGPHETLYNRFIHWSRLGVFDRIFASLAAEGPMPESTRG